jgi:hypothetical protein
MLKTCIKHQTLYCGLSVVATPECLYKGISHPTSFIKASHRIMGRFFYGGCRKQPGLRGNALSLRGVSGSTPCASTKFYGGCRRSLARHLGKLLRKADVGPRGFDSPLPLTKYNHILWGLM